MHWLDFVLLLVLGLGGLLGLRSGLLWQVARLVIFGAGIYACIHYHDDVAWQLLRTFEGLNALTAKLMAYAVIFLGVCLIGSLITWVLEGILKAANLKPLDRILGALVGILKAALLSGGVLIGMALYGSDEMKASLAGSTIAPPLLDGMEWVLSFVPQELKDKVHKAVDDVKKSATKKASETQGDNRDDRDGANERAGSPPMGKRTTTAPPRGPTWGPLAPRPTP